MITKSKLIKIAGAGPAGLTAAIILAKNGYEVKVYEQHSRVGSRFNDDYQGLENWSREEDVLEELKDSEIETTWWCKPFDGGVLFDPKFRPIDIFSDRPLFYMIRRGPYHPESLDLNLLNQAKSAGVDIVFNTRKNPEDVDVVAGGPRGRPSAIAAGITFNTQYKDFACAILNEKLAPSGYAYFLVSEGQATLATVLFKDFNNVHQCLKDSRLAIIDLMGINDIENVKQWGGYGSFSVPKSGEKNGVLYIGEAAGFQDFLFGFGIRNAMISGKLAAISIINGKKFDDLWNSRLLPHLQASLVNRYVYDKLGGVAKKAFWYFSGNSAQPDRFMHWLYGYSPIHRFLFPLLQKREIDG